MTAGRYESARASATCRSWRFAASLLWLAAVLTGCSVPGKALIESPLSLGQQQQAVLEVVPRGTSRGEAEKRLRAAGIEFAPAGNGSIYYLSLWNRPDGERWHINVALLFDSAGKLYQMRPADATTSVAGANPLPGSRHPPADGEDAPADSLHVERELEPADEGPARVAFPAQSSRGGPGTR